MSRALAILDGGAPPSYGGRLQRLRWRRRGGTSAAFGWSAADPAAEALAGASEWLVVLDPAALPVAAPAPLEAIAGRVRLAAPTAPAVPPAAHTLRELEGARLEPSGRGGRPPALLFRAADFPPRAGETVGDFLARLALDAEGTGPGDGFAAVSFDASSRGERPELTRRIPPGARRVLDVGCGAGGAIASAHGRRPAWNVTGIEADAALASEARSRCDRVLEGDLRRVLPELARSGERFDTVVFADVLEHLEDPVAALAAGLSVAAAGARLLVSVPNVGHLSVVRDLVAGRFDPVPSGLTDAGHLRWFTRAFLAEAIEESGWRLVGIEGEPGAPPAEAAGFLAATGGWPERDAESLLTYQWIATGGA